jgi:uracil DNA glycosylase
LNAVLTVEAHKANSHQGKGWENFTDAVIKLIAKQKSNIVFMLWGNYAAKKAAGIDAVSAMTPSFLFIQAVFGSYLLCSICY